MIAESIVVYRSKMEQMQDEAALDLMENHPEIILIILGIVFTCFLVAIIGSFFRRRY